ncbi:Uncharacterized protein GBIM_06915 [Gryllus bimaculatus]|nr:Uncharacterized protein GBIM_06915 [Gryllus bimaculatus]
MELDPSNDEFLKAGIMKIEHCLSYMQSYWKGYSASAARRKKEWIELLNDLERLPFKFRINELRKEIKIMWDKCYKSEQERKLFTEFYTDNYSESLLMKHGEELEKLNVFYLQHQELIDLLLKYEEMCKCVTNIQKQTQNPERLFKNRGAQLLKEEHDRKMIARIPHMQNIILKAIRKKESEGIIFLIYGQHFSDVIKQHNTKIEEKKAVKRLSVRSASLRGSVLKRCRTMDNIRISDCLPRKSNHRSVQHAEMK